MKGALLKEFYVWRKTGLSFILAYVLFGLVYAFIGNLSTVLLGVMLGGINRAFLDDEKNNWNDYSRVLPYSTAHRVSARYIIILCEIVVALVATTLMNVFDFYREKDATVLAEYFEHLNFSNLSVSNTVWNVVIVLTGLAFIIPINYIFKGNKRTVISMIPTLLVLIAILMPTWMLASPFLMGSTTKILLKIFYYEKWVIPVFLAISVAMLAVSWIVSIIINTNSGRDKLKKLKITAIILTVAVVAAGAVSAGILYKNGRFEKDETDYYSNLINENSPSNQGGTKSSEPTEAELQCREDFAELMETFFDEMNVGVPLEKSREQLESLGFKEEEYGSGRFYNGAPEGGNICVELGREEKSDAVATVYVSADVGVFYIEKATTKELDEIGNSFFEGMTEREMLDKMKELNVVPQYIREYPHPDFGKTQYYYIEYRVNEYNGGGSTSYSIHIDLIDGVIQDLRLYDY